MQKQIKSFPLLRFEEFKESWNISKLEQCINQITGYAFKGNEITEDENGTPLLRGINITEGKIRHNKKIDRYFSGHIKKFEKYLLKTGDLVLGMDGSKVGKNVALVTHNDTGSLLIQRVARLRAKEGVSINFIYQNINNSKFHRYVDIVNTSSGIPHISSKQINNFKIGLPSLPEQQKIASFLSSVDKRIELLQKKKDLLEDYKKGVMQQLFSQQLRFKDENGNEFPDWEERKVSEVFRVTRGNVLSVNKMKQTKEGEYCYPVYSSQTKDDGLTGYFNEFLYSNAITWTTDGANAGEVKFRKGKFYCTNVCGVLLSEDGQANNCISEMLNAISRKYVSYVGNPKLMNGTMASIKINFPSVQEQKKIASFLMAIDSKIETTSKQIEGMQTFKKGLLQQMFV